jgi:tape measure domain-containing protein
MEGGNKIMPNSVDNRVVEMQFDNAKFEKNINQSIKSLKDLDKALQMEDAAKGFNKIEKAANDLDLSKLDKTLDTINYRFSTLGIAGASAINELTKSVINFGKKFYDNTIGQIKNGGMSRAMNIASAKFQLEGLGVAWKDIEEDINYGVKDTAYGLDAAAKAASQLTASGIELGDEMKQALRGISGVAAMTNSSYEEISRIFTTVAGQGRMMGDQLNQLSARGLNAAATLGKAMNKSEAEIREMVSKGQISFRDFAKAMDDAYGAHAKDANKTFTGALSNMKAALSRIGADFATPYMDNMIRIFNSTTKLIDKTRAALKPISQIFSDIFHEFSLLTSNMLRSSDMITLVTSAVKGVVNVFGILRKLINPISIAFNNIFPGGFLKTLANVAKKFEKITSNFKLSRPTVTAVIEIFQGLFSVLNLVLYVLQNIAKALSPVLEMIMPIANFVVILTGKLANVVTELVGVITKTKKFESVLRAVKGVLNLVMIALGLAVLKLVEFVRKVKESEVVKDIINDISDAIITLASYAMPLLAGVGAAITGAFSKLLDIAKGGKINGFFSDANKKSGAFFETVDNGTTFLSKLLGIFKGGFKNLPSTVYAAGDALVKTNKASEKLTKGGLIPGLSKFSGACEKLGGVIDNLGNVISTNLKNFGLGRALITGFSLSLISLFTNCARLAGTFSNAFKGIPSLIKSIGDAFRVQVFTAKAKVVIAGLAISIVALAGALALLTLVDSHKLIIATKCLGGLIAIMAVAATITGLVGKGFDKFKNITFSFMAFAGSIILLAMALKQLLSIDADLPKIGKCLFTLATIMGAMTLVIIAITKWAKPFSIVMGSGFMLAFALSTKMLVGALKTITELDMAKLNSSIKSLLGIMLTLGGVAAACTLLSPFAGIGFMGIVAGFLLLVKGLSMMADVDLTKLYELELIFKRVYDTIHGFLILLEWIVLLKVILNGIKEIASIVDKIKNPVKGINKGIKELGRAAEIAAVGVTFLMMAQGLYKLSEIDPDRVAQAKDFAYNIGTAIITVAAVFTALSAVLPKDNIFTSIGNAIKGFGIMLIGIAVALKIADSLENPTTSFLVIIGITAILFAFIGLLTTLQAANPMIAMGIKTAIALSLVLGALVLDIGLLSMIASTPGGLGAVVASGLMIATVVGTLCGALAALGTIKNWKTALAATTGMALIIGALGGVFYLMKDIDAGKIWGQGVFILLAIGLLSGTIALLSKIQLKDALGALAIMGVASGVFIAFAGFSALLSKCDPTTLQENLKAVLIAIGLLTLVFVALGAVSMATGGAFDAALLAVAAALAAFAGSLLGFAAVGLVFAAAAAVLAAAFILFATGLDMLTDVLIKIQENVDFAKIAGGLAVIAAGALGLLELVSLGITALIIAALGAALMFATPFIDGAVEPFRNFGKSIQSLADSISYFAKADFDGILGNMAALAGIIAELLILEPSLLVLATTLGAFASSMYGIDNYTVNLQNDLKMLKEQIGVFDEAVTQLCDSFDRLPTKIQETIETLSARNVVQFIADFASEMRQMSNVEMPSVGRKIANDIIDGFQEIATEAEARSLTQDFIRGIVDGANLSASELTALGEYIAGMVIAGARGPNGFDEHSPSKEAILEMVQFVMGLRKGADVSQSTLDEIGEFIGTEITTETLESLERGETSWIDFLGKAGMDMQSFMNGLNLELPIKAKLYGLFDDVDPRTVEGYNPSMASIPGYTQFYQAKGSGRIKDYNDLIKDSSTALDKEIKSLNANTGGTKSNTKAKKENEKANDKKTEAIDEESEALGEETEAVEDNEEEIRAQAEEIEVITEKFDGYLNTLDLLKGYFGTNGLSKAMSKFWSRGFDKKGLSSMKKVNKAFKESTKGLNNLPKTLRKAALALNGTGDNYTKLSKKIAKSSKQIEKYANKTGKTVVKMHKDYAKVFMKSGDSLEKFNIRLSKNIKNMGKHIAGYKQFMDEMNNMDVNESIYQAEDAEWFINNLRKIEKYVTTKGSAPSNVQNFLNETFRKLTEGAEELTGAINILGKNIDGVSKITSNKSQSTAYVEDAFISLAATLYDGSEAANEYATEHAKLLFLMENGLATEEEVAEHYESYIHRINQALLEYQQTVDQTLRSSMKIFDEFNKNLLDDDVDLLSNIESQIAGYKQWSDMLMELSKRGLDVNVLKTLTDEGVQSYGKLKKMLEMTRGELALFNQRYKESQYVIQQSRDTALAALANATTRANQRAASASKDMSLAQMKVSKKLAKQLISDAKAVADNQAKYRSFTKAEEKKYLDALTEEERAAYQQRLKEAQKANKAEEKLANKEIKRRKKQAALEKKYNKIDKYITSFKKLQKAYKKYIDDAKGVKHINEQIAKSLESVEKKIKKTNGTSIKNMKWNFIKLADSLESTGQEGLSYFEELKERIDNYVDSMKNAVKITDKLFDEYQTADKMEFGKLFRNALNHIDANNQLKALSTQLRDRNVDYSIWEYIYNKYMEGGDIAGAVEFIKMVLSLDEVQLNALTREFQSAKNSESELLSDFMNNMAYATGGSAVKELEDARKKVTKAENDLAEAQNKAKDEVGKIKKDLKSTDGRLKQLYDERERALKAGNNVLAAELEVEIAHVTATRETLLDAIAKAENSANETISKLKTASDKAKKKVSDLENKTITSENKNNVKALMNDYNKKAETAKAEVTNAQADVTNAQKDIDHLMAERKTALAQMNNIQKELTAAQTRLQNTKGKSKKKEIEAEIKRLQSQLQTAQANLSTIDQSLSNAEKKRTSSQEKLTEATANYTGATQEAAKWTDEYNKIIADQKASEKLWRNIQDFIGAINNADITDENKGLVGYLGSLKKILNDTSGYLKNTRETAKEAMAGIKGAIDQWGVTYRNTQNLFDYSKLGAKTITSLDEITVAFFRLAESVESTGSETDDWFTNMSNRLNDYYSSLQQTLSGQKNLFDEFKRYSGESATDSNTYLHNMETQIDALTDWLTNLETLSRRGVSGGLLSMFASEGTASFEKVAAFVEASDKDIADLNLRFERYEELMKTAADKAMAYVGNAFTDGAIAIQKGLKRLEDMSAHELADTAADAMETTTTMVITGVRDGVTKALPEILISAEETANKVVAKLGDNISSEKVTQAVTTGLTSVDSAIATTLALTLNDFYDLITAQAVNKFKMAVDSINSYVNTVLQDEYVITLHVNTDEFDAAIARMNSAIYGINTYAGVTSDAYNTSRANQMAPSTTAGDTTTSNVTNVSYTQNNYSPKALSRAEIYRQTNNQLSTFELIANAANGG